MKRFGKISIADPASGRCFVEVHGISWGIAVPPRALERAGKKIEDIHVGAAVRVMIAHGAADQAEVRTIEFLRPEGGR
jgi:hypothetical protein